MKKYIISLTVFDGCSRFEYDPLEFDDDERYRIDDLTIGKLIKSYIANKFVNYMFGRNEKMIETILNQQ